MKVKDSMSRRPQTVSPDATLVDARELMLWGKIRHLVVTSDMDIVGIISARDIADHQARTGESIYSNPSDTVSVAMTDSVETIGPYDELREASYRMAARKLGCLPVVEDGELVGMLTTNDVLASTSCPVVPEDNNRPTVLDAMTESPKTINEGDALLEAVARMQEFQIRHLPVVDSEHVVVGMLSDRDLRTAFGNPQEVLSQWSSSDARLRVRDWMTSPALTATPTDDCISTARRFAKSSIGALPVVDPDGHIIGILSYVDVLRALADYAQTIA